MLNTKFMKIRQPVLEKKIFEGFLPYMSVAAILVKTERVFNKLSRPGTIFGTVSS